MGVCPRKRIPLPDLRILEDFMVMDEYAFNDYVVIKALEDGVNIIGLTRGKDTKFHHTEKLDAGEVYIAQFTEVTSAIKINGKAQILTKLGEVISSAEEN